MKTAVFDFDGTIAKGDSVVTFLLFAFRKRLISIWFLLKVVFSFGLKKLIPSAKLDPKEMAHSFIKGMKPEDMENFCREYIREKIMPRIFPQAVDEINKLHQNQIQVVVVSASADVYMRLICEFLPVDKIISTRCLMDSDGRYTGKLGDNCRGSEKTVRLQQEGITGGIIAGYGDSFGDRFLLDIAKEKILVNPSSGLRKYYRVSGKAFTSVNWKCRKDAGTDQ